MKEVKPVDYWALAKDLDASMPKDATEQTRLYLHGLLRALTFTMCWLKWCENFKYSRKDTEP